MKRRRRTSFRLSVYTTQAGRAVNSLALFGNRESRNVGIDDRFHSTSVAVEIGYRTGYFSSTGRCFDIGNTVRAALERFDRTREPYAGSTAPNSAGNGSLMRLAPVALFFTCDPPNCPAMGGGGFS